MTQTTQDIGEWLIYNKSSLISDIDKYVKLMPELNIEDKITLLLKNLALSYHGESFTTEQIAIAFNEPEILMIIKNHFVREWTHE